MLFLQIIMAILCVGAMWVRPTAAMMSDEVRSSVFVYILQQIVEPKLDNSPANGRGASR